MEMGWKRHSCALVSAMEEYTGPQRPGIILSLFIILRLLMVQSLLSSLACIVSDSTLQYGWTDATQLLF
jgi:hypothetical protein